MSADPIVIERPRRSIVDGADRVTWTIDGHDVSIWSYDTEPRHLQDVMVAPFAVAGAHLGRPVVVEGEVSRRLHRGLSRLAKVHQQWFDTSPLELRADRLVRRTNTGGATALAFTCGIDSFHALFSRPTPPDTLLFVNGFDIEVGDAVRLEHAMRGLTAVADERGAKLTVVHTDLRRHPTFAPIDWVWTHGAALAGIGHSLDDHERLVVASSWAISAHEPWGSHFRTDHLLGSEALKIEHAGAPVIRLEKTRLIAHEPLAQHHLRVCWEHRTEVGNCGRCTKCAFTQLCLHHLGVLDEFDVFPPLDDVATLVEDDAIITGFRYAMRSLLDDGLDERFAGPIRERITATGSEAPPPGPRSRQLYDRMLLAARNR